MKTLLLNANVFNGKDNDIFPNQYILINGNKIESLGEMSQAPVGDEYQRMDLAGQYVMPGLIDAHVHITAAQVNLQDDALPDGYVHIRAAKVMEKMLARGFTSIRDAGGSDFGIKLALEKGLFEGPRLFSSEKALSQTAGHGDFRHRTATMSNAMTCACSGSRLSMLCDGVDGVRKAAREQLRQGADQIKIMADGGIASPTDKIGNLQFSNEEMLAIVEEAAHFGTYVMAHAYTPLAIIRCVKNGVRSIEHGNLLDDAAAQCMAEHNAYLVPTLSIFDALFNKGRELGFPDISLQKLSKVKDQCLSMLKIARRHKVNVGFGTDLLGDLTELQTNEFKLRSQIETNFEVLNSATFVNGRLVSTTEKLGVMEEHAVADMLVLDLNPLADLSIFDSTGSAINLIIKNGEMVKRRLHSKRD